MTRINYFVKFYEANGNIDGGSDVIGYVFQNEGNVDVRINGYLLKPFDSLDTRSPLEEDRTKYQAIFAADQAGAKKLSVLFKTKM